MMENKEQLIEPILEKQEVAGEAVADPNPLSFKENLYEHINVSLKTMDLLIGIIVVFIIVFLTFGIWQSVVR